MGDESQQQEGSTAVAVERTCDGRCCAVFPLSWGVMGEDGIATWLDEGHTTEERAFIADMLIPLNKIEATQRWADMGYTEPLALLEDDRPLWTCRHWNTETRLCDAYEQRPKHLCADFPYGDACHHKSCNYRQPISYLVGKAHREWEALSGPQVGSTPE